MEMMSNSILDPLRNIIVYNRRRIRIDNAFFRMHYVSTCILLIACTTLVATKMYMGSPINCITNKELKDVVNEYCYIHSTFTRGRFEKGMWVYEPAKESEIYPGVRPALNNDRVTIHSYYQWVWVVLPLQAVAFYLPHWIWEKLERGIMHMLVGQLNVLMLSEDAKLKQRRKILLYLKTNKGYHMQYAISYAVSEVLNFINIIIQIFITDYFLDHAFTTYGLSVFQLTTKQPYHRDDLLARVFPTVTACRMATGGVAFGKQQHDILCVLSINIIHEKVYIVLWFWYLFVLVCSILCLTYRAATLHAPLRIFMMQRTLRGDELNQKAAYITTCHDYGEWFLIYRLSQNMDPVTFGELIYDIDQAFQKWDIGDLPRDEGTTAAPAPSAVNSPVHETYSAAYFRYVAQNIEDQNGQIALKRPLINTEKSFAL